jgi:hypothetical protein
VRPERRRRGDLVAAAVLVVLVVVAATVLWGTGGVAGTTSAPAVAASAEPPPAADVPAGFTEAWRAPSAATPQPVVSARAVVTADGSTVTGHDPLTGATSWTYSRDVPLCTVAAGFPGADDGVGRVLALYGEGPDWCSELTALRPDTGARAAAANPDTRPGARLLAAGSSVVGTGADYLEVLRSDLVKTLEYGLVNAPAQPERQPRAGCRYGSTALVSGRLGVVERCPDEFGDRLTVISPDGPDGADKPAVEFSVALSGIGATLVAMTSELAAVALPGPPRLLVFDRQGAQVDVVGLDVPESDLASDPVGGVAPVRSDGQRTYWWTGSRTVALDETTLRPVWTAPDALGPALPYGGGLLLPVRDGLAEIDPNTGSALRTLGIARADPLGPVRLDAVGEVVLEQRGTEVVALRPSD